MNKKILIIGSTGKLGSKILTYTHKNKIRITCIVGFKNKSKLLIQKTRYNIKNSFLISNITEKENFKIYLKKNKFDLVYFLDFGSNSLEYLNIFNKNNKNSIVAIANKEMLIAGGDILINQINLSKNTLIPLDSEHFSIFNSNIENKDINKIFITASGGPFYFNKKLDLKKVSFKQVISHPKWNMGINNSIDSSNFFNKILEIYELRSIYQIDIKKVSFILSRSAYIHSIIIYNSGSISINCFENDMLITLRRPLEFLFNLKPYNYKKQFLSLSNLKLEEFNDTRFKLYKHFKFLLSLNHSQQIELMIINNLAQKKYINGTLEYNDIVDFIIEKIKHSKPKKLNSIKQILSYIEKLRIIYDEKNF